MGNTQFSRGAVKVGKGSPQTTYSAKGKPAVSRSKNPSGTAATGPMNTTKVGAPNKAHEVGVPGRSLNTI